MFSKQRYNTTENGTADSLSLRVFCDNTWPDFDLISELQRLTTESAAQDARLRELEVENERLRAERSRTRNGGPVDAASSSSSSGFSAERFFDTQTPPSNLHEFTDKAQEFVQRHARDGRRVVLVTVNSSDARVIDEMVFE